MEDNYYSRQNANRKAVRKSRSNSKSKFPQYKRLSETERIESNIRKRQNKKLNYKKVAVAAIFLILIIYLICLGISKLFSKPEENVTVPTTVEPPKDITVNMAVIGDIMCHSTNFKDAYDAEKQTYDFSYVFTEIKDYIQSADLAIGNLETTFSGADVGYTGYPTFNTPEQLAQNLVDLGLDVISTANNHSLDKRYNGLVSTLDELDKVGLSHTGTYRSAEEQNTILTKDVNGIKFAFLAFTYGTNGIPVPEGKEYCVNLIDETLMLDQIEKAKALDPDVICVNMHWGDEYKLVQNKKQEEFADFLFKNGVDIILGSHPHVLEPMEKRTITLEDGTTKDGFLIYSLGNFMSGQVIDDTKNSIILQLKVTKHPDSTISIDVENYIPIYMHDEGEGQAKRYKLVDIDETMRKYESGDKSVTKEFYDIVKDSKKRIVKVLGENKTTGI